MWCEYELGDGQYARYRVMDGLWQVVLYSGEVKSFWAEDCLFTWIELNRQEFLP